MQMGPCSLLSNVVIKNEQSLSWFGLSQPMVPLDDVDHKIKN